METARWAHASLVVVVPVVRSAEHVLPTGASGWQLTGLFVGQGALSTPSEVAWDPITDERVRWALEPVLDDYSRVNGTKAEEAAVTAAAQDSDRRDGEGAAGAPAQVPRLPSLQDLVSAAGWLPAAPAQLAPPATTGTKKETKEAPAPLPLGCTIRAVEVVHLPTYGRLAGGEPTSLRTGPDDLDSFLVVHVLLSGEALLDPGQVAAYFGHPDRKADLRYGYHSVDRSKVGARLRVMSFKQWSALAAALGFAPVGPPTPDAMRDPRDKDKADGRRGSTKQVNSLRVWRPFVLSHLVPANEVPPSPFSPDEGLGHWDETQSWAWRMSGGQRLTQAWEPGRGAEDPTRNGIWVGSTWARATHNGLALVGTRGIDERGTIHDREGATWWIQGKFHNVEHVRVAGMVHRNATRLAILAIRQSERLQDHAERLVSSVEWPRLPAAPPEGDGAADGAAVGVGVEDVSEDQRIFEESVQAAARKISEMELALLRTRNQLWFTQLPGRPEESGLLRALQSAAGTPDLMVDVELELSQAARTLLQHEAVVAQARARREEIARAGAAAVMAQRLRDEDLERAERREAAAEDARQAEAIAWAAQASRQQRLDDGERARLAQEIRDKKLNDVLSGLSAFIGLFFVVDLALAVTQVRQGGGWGDVREALSVAAPALVLFGAGLVWAYFHLSKKEGAGETKDKATGGMSGNVSAGESHDVGA